MTSWSIITQVLLQPLAQGMLASPLQCVDLVVLRDSTECGFVSAVSEPYAVEEGVMNVTDGADPMWHAAAQAVRAGRMRDVNFTMNKWGIGRLYRGPFEKRMREVVPSMVAEGMMTVSLR